MDEWAMLRACQRGEKAVKEAGEAYLPMPSGFRTQADAGRMMYSAYQMRAQFSEILAPTIRGMVGVIHRTEAQIDMPAAMQGLWERATGDGLPLEALHRRITGELLLTGRYGLLAEASSEGSDLPWLAGYSAEALINWSEGRDFYVLDESGLIRDEFQWREQKRYRVLQLDGGRYTVHTYTGEEKDSKEIQPTARGGAALTEIPFVVMGPRDLSVAPSEPPLIGVARAALALYRLDADYRHVLYMSGQETLFIFNGEAPEAVGAGVVVCLTASKEDHAPDAKYVGPSGQSIGDLRQAIQDERANAASAGARLFDAEKKSAESGDALRIRYAAQTATLTSIAQASAQGLEKALRHIAVMIGVDPNTVVVRPNLSFIDATLSPTDAAALMALWQGGSISYQTFYEQLQKGEIASAERDHEAELKLIDAEQMGEDEDRQAALGSTPE
ncbi:DUF4055 domain-containing protein [Paracoccus angustae]|uniref:DUF4055 domain-containing protein n=2 Tax=Paracoccus angustae TaxID=1671480 RepID=A0ABV7TZI7_9RHOB